MEGFEILPACFVGMISLLYLAHGHLNILIALVWYNLSAHIGSIIGGLVKANMLMNHVVWRSVSRKDLFLKDVLSMFFRLRPICRAEVEPLELSEEMQTSHPSWHTSQPNPSPSNSEKQAEKFGNGFMICCRNSLHEQFLCCFWMLMEKLGCIIIKRLAHRVWNTYMMRQLDLVMRPWNRTMGACFIHVCWIITCLLSTLFMRWALLGMDGLKLICVLGSITFAYHSHYGPRSSLAAFCSTAVTRYRTCPGPGAVTIDRCKLYLNISCALITLFKTHVGTEICCSKVSAVV